VLVQNSISLFTRSDPNINTVFTSVDTESEIGSINLEEENVLIYIVAKAGDGAGLMPADMRPESLENRLNIMIDAHSYAQGVEQDTTRE